MELLGMLKTWASRRWFHSGR